MRLDVDLVLSLVVCFYYYCCCCRRRFFFLVGFDGCYGPRWMTFWWIIFSPNSEPSVSLVVEVRTGRCIGRSRTQIYLSCVADLTRNNQIFSQTYTPMNTTRP